MIKQISATALALVALGGAAPMIASAEPVGNTDVRYTSANIIDPGADADYMITVPSSIQFSNNKMAVTEGIEVKMVKKENIEEAYTGDRAAAVTATSKNGWFVENAGEKLQYKLTYDDKLLTADSKQVGKSDFSKSYTETGKDLAELTKKGSKKGTYTDIITFTVQDKAPTVK